MNQLGKWRSRLAPLVRRAAVGLGKIAGMYLDDILLICGGVCLVLAAAELGGRPAALITAGVWCTVYAVVVARAKGGGEA